MRRKRRRQFHTNARSASRPVWTRWDWHVFEVYCNFNAKLTSKLSWLLIFDFMIWHLRLMFFSIYSSTSDASSYSSLFSGTVFYRIRQNREKNARISNVRKRQSNGSQALGNVNGQTLDINNRESMCIYQRFTFLLRNFCVINVALLNPCFISET